MDGIKDFRRIVDILSWPQLDFDCRSFMVSRTVFSSMISKLKVEVIFFFRKDLYVKLQFDLISLDNFGPILVKNSLNSSAITCLFDTWFFLIIKYSGNSRLTFFLDRMSLMVAQVFLESNLYF